MLKIEMMILAVLVTITSVSQAAIQYFDTNGSTPGFGTTTNCTVDPTAAMWTTDSSGSSATAVFVNGNIAHFDIESAVNILFNWVNYGGNTFGGITTTSSGGGGVQRMQKQGGGGENISWSAGAVVNTIKANGFYWDLGTVGDFTKTGSQWLILADGVVKVDGVCTISEGNIIIRSTGTVNANSSFKLNGGQLRFDDNIDDLGPTVATIGVLSGSGEVTIDGSINSISNLTISTTGVNMTNNVATDLLTISWGAAVELTSGAVTEMEINKSGGTNQSDKLDVEWASRTLAVNGTLAVTLLSGSEQLVAGDTFSLFSTNITGTFTSIILPDFSTEGLAWDLSQLYVDGSITVISGPLYLGDGSTKPITATGTQVWDLVTMNWLRINSAVGVYQAWNNGDSAGFLGSSPVVALSGNVAVSNITRSGSVGGALTLEPQSASDTLTVNGEIDGANTQINFAGNSSAGVFAGDMALSRIVRLQILRGAVFAAGSSITSDEGGDIQFWGTAAGDYSTLTLNCKGKVVDFRKDWIVLGMLNGTTTLRDSADGNVPVTINSLNPGVAASSEGIGTVINDSGDTVDVTLGTGTHSFDIDYSGAVSSSDKLALSGSSTLTYGGTLNVSLLNGDLALGAVFDLFDAASLSGKFSVINLPSLPGGIMWDTRLLGVDGIISIIPAGFVLTIR